MRISQLFEKKKAVYSFEIFPPKASDDISKIYSTLESIKDIAPDYVSVTYSAGGSRNSRTAEIADLLKNRYGMEPLAHLTCVNSTMGEVEEAIDKLNKIGVENILALRGDRIEGQERGEFNYCTDLIPVIKRLSNADIGAACYPEGHPESSTLFSDIEHLKTKVDAGCSFLTTQMFFDNDVFYSFMSKVRDAGIYVPVIAGIMPVTNAKQIKRMMSLSGGSLPTRFRRIIDRFGDNPEAMAQAGIAYATEQIIDLYANGVKAVHVYSMNKPAVAAAIKANLSHII